MTETPDNGWFERHVVNALDRLESGQKTMLEKFEEHEKDDNKQFEAIRFEIGTTKAAQMAEVKTSARFWSAITGFVTLAITSMIHFWTKGGH